MIRIVPGTQAHAELLAPHLRQQDKDEIMASGGYTPSGALRESVSVSAPGMCWTALNNFTPFVMFGAAEHAVRADLGVVWLLGSDHIYKMRKRFLLESRVYVQKMHERFPVLANWVDARNTVSQRWLETLGFKALETNPQFGHERRPFILYASYKQCAHPQ